MSLHRLAVAAVEPVRGSVRSLLSGEPDGAPPWVRAMAADGDAGWFGPGSTVWTVHQDAATLVGGIRALMLQALHPVVLAGFDQHSGYREDPIGRLQRTAAFVTLTAFGTTAQAEAACRAVERAHEPVRGVTDDGVSYSAADPRLMAWVHLTLVDSLATAVAAYGRTRFDRDAYLAETARIGEQLGADPLPRSARDVDDLYAEFRPELAATPATAKAHAFILDPPLPAATRAGYKLLAAAAAATLPADLAPLLAARPVLSSAPARLVGTLATRVLSTVLGPSPAATAAANRVTRTPLPSA